FGHTLVAAPHAGTQLAPDEVLRLVRRWARARPLARRRVPWPAALGAAAGLLAVVGLTWGLRGWMSPSVQPIASDDQRVRGFQRDGPTDRAGHGAGSGERPNLFLLGIGVSDYEDPRYKLDYASKDADDLVAAFRSQKGLAFADVYLQELTDKTA